MNNKIYHCEECGWSCETDFHELECPICHSKNVRVEVDDEMDSEVIAQMIEENNNFIEEKQKDQIKQMEDNIKNLGNDRTWELIEQMSYAEIRVTSRDYFFKAGGVAVNRELVI